MVDGKTNLTGIFGYPLEHSMSPLMHNACFLAHKLNYCYVPLRVKPGMLKDAVNAVKVLGFRGINVTIPYKVEMLNYVDELSHEAEYIGAVNTIVIENNRIKGFNTDAPGFIASLRAKSVEIKNKKVLVLGAGGAARAVCCGLLTENAKQVMVAARNQKKINEFVARFLTLGNITGCLLESEEYLQSLQECDIVVNCTPIGMFPHNSECLPIPWNLINTKACVCDLVYNPLKTAFLSKAEEYGLKTIGGLGMLVYQGSIAFEMWTGVKPDNSIMLKTVEQELLKQFAGT